VMRRTPYDRHGARVRALIVLLWRAGLRVQEALAWASATSTRGGGRCSCAKARVAAGARSAWTPGAGNSYRPGSTPAPNCRSGRCSASSTAPHAAGPGRAPASGSSSVGIAAQAGVRPRFAPHQLRHARAVELAREGVSLNVTQRRLGHANLATTSIYLQGIDTDEIIATVHARRAPMMSATAGL
jgi:hypothetical protein